MRGAVDWIPANPNARGLSHATTGQLPHRFVSQSAAARNYTNVAFFVNVTWRNSDPAASERIFPFARCNNPRTIRTDKSRLAPIHHALHLYHIINRNSLCDADN